MGTTEEKLARLNETKALLKTRLTEKGIDVASEDNFYNLADKVGEIQTKTPVPEIGELGTTINLFGYDWLVVHKTSNLAYLITKYVLKNTQWDTESPASGYVSSNIKNECDSFALSNGINSLDYVVEGNFGKVFIATLEQMNAFDRFDSDEKRMATYSDGKEASYWTSSLYYGNYQAYCIGIYGETSSAPVTDTIYGFRPCIAIKTQ